MGLKKPRVMVVWSVLHLGLLFYEVLVKALGITSLLVLLVDIFYHANGLHYLAGVRHALGFGSQMGGGMFGNYGLGLKLLIEWLRSWVWSYAPSFLVLCCRPKCIVGCILFARYVVGGEKQPCRYSVRRSDPLVSSLEVTRNYPGKWGQRKGGCRPPAVLVV